MFFLNRISSGNKTNLIIVIIIFINLFETQPLANIHSKIRSQILIFLKRITVLGHLWKHLRSIVWVCYLRRKSICTLIVFLFLLKKSKWIVSFYILKRSYWLFVYLIQFIFLKLHVAAETFFYDILYYIARIQIALINFI